MVDVKEINKLYDRLFDINTWIDNNPDIKEPNYYEIMDSALMVGDIFSRLKNHEARTIDEDISLVISSHKLRVELSHMIASRDLTNHPFVQENEEVSRLMFHTINDCLSGDITHFDDVDIEKARNHVLRKCVSVPFYIWQVRQNNSEYMYDNIMEFNEILESYAIFRGYCSLNLGSLGVNDNRMLKEMGVVLEQIGNNYKYNNKNKVIKKSDDFNHKVN